MALSKSSAGSHLECVWMCTLHAENRLLYQCIIYVEIHAFEVNILIFLQNSRQMCYHSKFQMYLVDFFMFSKKRACHSETIKSKTKACICAVCSSWSLNENPSYQCYRIAHKHLHSKILGNFPTKESQMIG